MAAERPGALHRGLVAVELALAPEPPEAADRRARKGCERGAMVLAAHGAVAAHHRVEWAVDVVLDGAAEAGPLRHDAKSARSRPAPSNAKRLQLVVHNHARGARLVARPLAEVLADEPRRFAVGDF